MKSNFNIKKILLIILFAAPVHLFGQSGGFILKGKLGNLNAPAKIFLSYRSAKGKDFKDSCVLMNGVFELKGEVTNPVNAAQLYLKAL